MTFMAVALGAVVSSLVASISLKNTNRESHVAMLAAESALERIRGETFANAFRMFNANPADDPGGAGTAPGNSFAVTGLSPRTGDADGRAGEIQFPGDGNTLRENVVDAGLGMSRDLSGDGVVDNADHSGDYVVLPVRVRVQWQGETGDRELEIVGTVVSLQ